MPDPRRLTVSATQVAALFNRSKWDTRWTLWKQFRGEAAEHKEDARMSWGKKMQPLLLEQAAADLALEVKPWDKYLSRGVIGATRDAEIFCSDRGYGALETKCVFDYGQWMRAWDGGNTVPFDYEAQLQAQMYTGGGTTPFGWGVIAAWVCGDMYYFERKSDEAFQAAMVREAQQFLAEVREGQEPDPFGVELELPELARSWGVAKVPSQRDLRDFEDARDMAETARMYAYAGDQERFWKKTRAAAKAKLVGWGKGCDEMALPGGVWVNYNKTKAGALLVNVNAAAADDSPASLPEFG